MSRKHERYPHDAFPFSVPAIRTFTSIEVDVGVTMFVGENGSGKSTLLEGIATAAELPTSDRTLATMDASLRKQRELGDALRLSWLPRSRKGLFLRAEDFFGQVHARARAWAREKREKRELATGVVEAHVTESGAHVDEVGATAFLEGFDARSHGESFLDLFEKIQPGGLYVLDEPEAPLSPKRQIRFLEMIEAAAVRGAQFLIATHSPILLSCRDARIFDFDRAPIAEAAYDDLEHVRVTKDFFATRATPNDK